MKCNNTYLAHESNQHTPDCFATPLESLRSDVVTPPSANRGVLPSRGDHKGPNRGVAVISDCFGRFLHPSHALPANPQRDAYGTNASVSNQRPGCLNVDTELIVLSLFVDSYFVIGYSEIQEGIKCLIHKEHSAGGATYQ